MTVRTQRRTAIALVSAGLLTLGQVSAVAAAPASSPPVARPTSTAVAGAVSIDGGAAATASSDVTVAVAAPTTSASLLQVSNDDGTTWVQLPYATSFTWSLIDPAAGGVDADGTRAVTVEAGDGIGPWTPLGADSILLDRTPPTTYGVSAPDGAWRGLVSFDASDVGVGVARTEVSLDGEHWRSLSPSPWTFTMPGAIDYHESMIGGSWVPGPRTVYARAVDRLGNTSQPQSEIVSTPMTRVPGEMPANFEFPLPAITGQPFTIKPTFDPGYHLAPGQWCEWRLKAGDSDVRLEALYDETLIDVSFPVAPKNGVCAPWTFTLPYTPPLEYTWRLDIMGNGDASYYYTDDLAGSFRAELGGTSRAITSSNLPLAYLLPDREIVGTDGTVTYRLFTAGGMSLVNGGWWCESVDHPPPSGVAPQEQHGGTSFDCRITYSGPWVAGWVYYVGERRYLIQFDPVSDRSRPVVTNLRVDPAINGRLGAGTKVTVRWSGRDSGTGVARYELQGSRNGGAYVAIALPSHRTTSIDRSVVLGSTYRYRARAVDYAGNVGLWSYTAPIRPAAYDDSSSIVHFAGGWTVGTLIGGVHGTAHATSTSGATAWVHLTGRSVAWLAPRGPDAGFAQVWVDGVLVGTVDLTAASVQPSAIVWRRSWTTVASHLIRIRVLGTAGRPNVAVDAFVVLR